MILAASVADRHRTENLIVLIAIAVGLIAAWALWMYTRPTRAGSRRDYPQTAPRTQTRTRRPAAGPLPPVGEIDATDYVALASLHIPCQATTCSHKPWPGQHCRCCGMPYPCPLSGPLNPGWTSGPSGFDDRRAYQRAWRETGRWDV